MEEIFLSALELENPAQRNAFLDATCGHDPQMRRELDQLLTTYPNADHFFGSAGVSVDRNASQTL